MKKILFFMAAVCLAVCFLAPSAQARRKKHHVEEPARKPVVPKQEDFSHHFPVAILSDTPLQKIILTEGVYRKSRRGDNGDIRVFNGAGQSVPFYLKAQIPVRLENSDGFDAPFFPVRVSASESQAMDVYVETNERGAIVNVRQTPPQTEAPVTTYLIDLSEVVSDPVIGRVTEISISGKEGQGQAIGELSVKTGDDLVNWRVLVPKWTFVDMDYAGKKLSNRTIKFDSMHGRYLRLDWIQAPKGYEIDNVYVGYTLEHEIPPERQSFAFHGNKIEDGKWRFSWEGYFPLESAQIGFLQKNTFVEAEFHDVDRRRTRYSGPLYNLDVDGHRLTSEEIPLNSPSQTWDLTILSGSAGERSPEATFYWTPHELIFLQQGSPPYVLAVGNALTWFADENTWNKSYFENLNLPVATAELGLATAVVVPEVVKPAEVQTGIPRKYYLWVALGGGVLFLGYFAFTLLKEMNRAPGNPSNKNATKKDHFRTD